MTMVQQKYESPWTEAEAWEWLDDQRIANLPDPYRIGYGTKACQ